MTKKNQFKSTRIGQAKSNYNGAPVYLLEQATNGEYRPIFGVIMSAVGSTTSIESKRPRKAAARNK